MVYTMSRKEVLLSGLLAIGMAGLFSGLAGCNPVVWKNLTKERTGNVTLTFVNNTTFRASFSYGSWNRWNEAPGPVVLQQLRLEANTTSSNATLPCDRNISIGTQPFVDRVILTEADDTTGFDPEAFDTVVHFSAADTDDDTSGLPTAGSALGVDKLLGVDFSCADQLVFTFVVDPDAEGGFRIDYEVILDENTND